MHGWSWPASRPRHQEHEAGGDQERGDDRLLPLGADRALSPRALKVGALGDGLVEACLGKVVHMTLGGHDVQGVATASLPRVRNPEGPVDQEFRNADPRPPSESRRKARRPDTDLGERG